jgi:hypothetical protein
MKTCPTCNRTYTDASLNFCLEDGTPLSAPAAPAQGNFDPNATIRYPDSRATQTTPSEPYRPPTSANVPPVNSPPVYHVPTQGSSFGQQQHSSMPAPLVPPRKSSAIWWILGGLMVLGIILVGAVIMIIALASMSSNSNSNANSANANSRAANRNANSSNSSNTNTSVTPPAQIADDFSTQTWGTGNYSFGDIWYADDEYHMRAKDGKYLVMYAPNADYKTANATVRVTARSVDGTAAANGFGLIVHGKKSDAGELEDYALLIYTGNQPKYEIIKHTGGEQSAIVSWTSSKVIRSGTNPNQLEVRTRGSELSFFINGQYVDRISDTENFRGGIAGLYTSDNAEIAFDDLEIKR